MMPDQVIDLRIIFAFYGFIFGLLVFYYKNHETNQFRLLKNIADNLKGINDLCIDVFAKKNITNDILPKISMQLNLLEFNINLFPAGKFYYRKKTMEVKKDNLMEMIQEYKDLIFTDTPIENRSLDINDFENANKRLDSIINQSLNILKELENHLP